MKILISIIILLLISGCNGYFVKKGQGKNKIVEKIENGVLYMKEFEQNNQVFKVEVINQEIFKELLLDNKLILTGSDLFVYNCSKCHSSNDFFNLRISNYNLINLSYIKNNVHYNNPLEVNQKMSQNELILIKQFIINNDIIKSTKSKF